MGSLKIYPLVQRVHPYNAHGFNPYNKYQ